MTYKSAIENLINGNLTDALRKAKRHSFTLIRYSAEEDFGMSSEKAVSAAMYLKSDEVSRESSWQAWCNADQPKTRPVFAETLLEGEAKDAYCAGRFV